MNHYLKITFLLLSIIPSSVIAQAKTLCETIDVKIDFYDAEGCSPSMTISLSKSGLTCTSNEYENMNNDSISYSSLYVPYARLNQENFFHIDEYVRKNFPKKINKKKLGVYDKEGKKIGSTRYFYPMLISFVDQYNGKYWEFTYYYCDEKVDKLIDMLDLLIPDAQFLIFPRCL